MSQADDSDALTQDRVFEILSSARRRYVLHYLNSRGEPVELRELADQIAKWETGEETLTSQQRKRVYVSLYQTHIPRLEDAGVIEYDTETGEVKLTDRAYDIDRYVDSGEEERRWPLYYFAVALASLVIYAAVEWGLDSSDAGITIAIGLVILLSFITLSLFHYVSVRRREGVLSLMDDFISTNENE